jgi:hypothetical protein
MTELVGFFLTVPFKTSSNSFSSGFLALFFSRESQNRASNSGDLEVDILQTLLRLTNSRQALSNDATKPASPENAVCTRSLYFL